MEHCSIRIWGSKMVKGVSRISVSVPSTLLKRFDKLTAELMLDRSKGVQVAMRDFLTEHGWAHKLEGLATGSIVMIYDHDVKGLEEALTDIQHAYQNAISSSMHVHLDERNCLSVIAVKGEAEAIQNLGRALIANRGVKQLKTAIVSVQG